VVVYDAIDADVSIAAVVSSFGNGGACGVSGSSRLACEDGLIGALSDSCVAALFGIAVGVVSALCADSHGVIGAVGLCWVGAGDSTVACIIGRRRNALIGALGARVDAVDIAEGLVALVIAAALLARESVLRIGVSAGREGADGEGDTEYAMDGVHGVFLRGVRLLLGFVSADVVSVAHWPWIAVAVRCERGGWVCRVVGGGGCRNGVVDHRGVCEFWIADDVSNPGFGRSGLNERVGVVAVSEYKSLTTTLST